ncbi:MAG: cytochrome c oxidase assembly protein [Thermoanaerobaculia bacterium]
MLFATPALAHEGHDHTQPVDAATTWTFDPLVLSLLGIAAVLYARGAMRSRAARPWHVVSFGAGLLTIFIAQISPLDALSDVLFSAHMAQHELLVLVAAPLVVMGRPLVVFLRGLPTRASDAAVRAMRRPAAVRLWRVMTGPFNVWLLHGIVLLVWHARPLYEGAIRNEAIHFLQHAMFLGTAVLFWWALVHGRYGRLGYGMAVLYVFATAAYSGALGALVTLAPRLWYPLYDARTRAVGLDPLQDQQLAGLIMWVPAGIILIIAGLAFFAAWLGAMEARHASNG